MDYSPIASKPHSKIPACSFKHSLHPEYEAIKAECEPWILAFVAPPSSAAAQYWRDCLIPYFISLACAPCRVERVVLLVKFYTWLYVNDTDDDDLNVRGSAPNCIARRNHLILSCFDGEPALDRALAAADACGSEAAFDVNDSSNINITKGLPALQDIWKDISKDMSLPMQSRFVKGMAEFLNANRVQAQYRKADSLPSVEEYIKVVRRPASLALPSLMLLEYGLGIELDEETLCNDLLLQLHDAVVDHLGLFNDVMSFESETHGGDYFNLPSVIFREMNGTGARPGLSFADAVQEAVSMVEEIDKLVVRLMEKAEKSRLMEKPEVGAYLRGLVCWVAGNVEWSLKTARYSHTCSSQGIVSPLPGHAIAAA